MSLITPPENYGFNTLEEKLAYREAADSGRDAAALLIGQLLEKTHTAATHDKLTGLLNRSGLDEALNFLPINPDEVNYVVVSADIKNFKLINDTLGHNVGDKALRATGQAFAFAFRQRDIVARTGGDEFVAVAHTGFHANDKYHRHGGLTAEQQSQSIGSRIDEVMRVVIERYNKELGITDDKVKFGFSTGFSVWTPSNQGFDEAVAAADAQMYVNKRAQGDSLRPNNSELE
ncbi:MAG: GGDEF domain-containing protein [Candidatus Saccharimonadales bacterium]